MGQTTLYQLPYPESTDPADVPTDLRELADRLELVMGGGSGTSLPASPVDGQEVFYLADPANGVIWHLRYRAANPTANKWEFLGGAPLTAMLSTTVPLASGTWTLFEPHLTIPLAGMYTVSYEAGFNNANAPLANITYVGIYFGGTRDDATVIAQSAPAGGIQLTISTIDVPHAVNAGATVQLAANPNVAGQAVATMRVLSARPIAVR